MIPLTLTDRIVLAALKNNDKFKQRSAEAIAKQVAPALLALNPPGNEEPNILATVEEILNSSEHAPYIRKVQGQPKSYQQQRNSWSTELESALDLRSFMEPDECEQSEITEIDDRIEHARTALAGVPADEPGKFLYELKFDMFLIFRCAQ